MLADAGYDVFIANFRGSKYSDHLNYKVTDKEFWEITYELYNFWSYYIISNTLLVLMRLPNMMFLAF